MNLCLRPASCPYRLYPHDTLCTYGAKQLKLLGFSQRHLFGCSLMCFRYTIVNQAVLHSGITDLAFSQRENCLFILIFGNRKRDRDRREMCADPVFQRCFKHVFHLAFQFSAYP